MRFDAGFLRGLLGDLIGIDGLQKFVRHLGKGLAAGRGGDAGFLFGIERLLHARESRGQGREGVFVAFPERDAEEDAFEFLGRLAIERARIGLVALADADGIDDDEVGLGPRFRAGDGLQIGGRKDAGAAPFHLLEIDAAAHVAQKDEALERFHVGAGGDHIDGDGDAELGREPELLDELLAMRRPAGLGML